MHSQERRSRNTTRAGAPFDTATVAAVWRKASIITGSDPEFRTDACGALIRRSEYGELGDHGWEIDHILPVSKNGPDQLFNLQPLHWLNNRAKGDHTVLVCARTA
jgi:5-methylcytosine-specific restriction endonuclease McrA